MSRAADVDYYAAVSADEEVIATSAEPDREDAWRRLMTGAGFWALLGIGMWAVERQADGEMIGHVGFFDFQREMDPSIAGEPEMGWIIRPRRAWAGIALEACRAALDWVEADLQRGSDPGDHRCSENEPSIRLAERLGFERLAEVDLSRRAERLLQAPGPDLITSRRRRHRHRRRPTNRRRPSRCSIRARSRPS